MNADIADHVEKILADAPQLNDEQRTRLAELLKPIHRLADDEVTRGPT